jgi:cytochrome b561
MSNSTRTGITDMNDTSEPGTAEPPASQGSTARGHGVVARLFHWITAALVTLMILAGVAMTSEGFDAWRDALYILHKGTGSILLLVIPARLLWRLATPGPGPLPASVPPTQQRLAGLSHGLLYALLLVMPVSGYVRTVGAGFPIELLDALGIPPLIPQMDSLAGFMAVVHAFGAYALTGLIALHLGAVAYHVLVARDGVVKRMWPPLPRASRRP